MKKALCLCVAALGLLQSVHAQEGRVFQNEIFVSAGVNVPLYDNVGTDAIFGIHYGHSYYNGMGFRAGVQYSPSVAGIRQVYGVPVAFTYRTRSRSMEERLFTGIDSAAESVASGWYHDDNHFGDGIFGFLAGLFDRVEFYAGITPGYIAGGNSAPTENRATWTTRWTEKPTSLSLSLDAGANLNFKIWRFDLKLMPAIHYNVLDNYRLHTVTTDPQNGQKITQDNALRWFFTLSGGLAFHF